MNTNQAIKERIPRIRKPEWANPESYLRLPLLPDNKIGPWAELYDDLVQSDVLDIEPGSQKILLMTIANEDGWEIYNGPISEHEQQNYAKIYTES